MQKLLQTKLFIPLLRPNLVKRPRLVERLEQGFNFGHSLTVIAAPAGFGKSTLAGEWIASVARPAAWLSLDEGDNDPTRFLTYLVAALQTIEDNTTAPAIGESILVMLQSPQPPPIETILTTLLNAIAAVPDPFLLVLDDYHLVESQVANKALTFILEHQPPQMHLVIATREDPQLPLARLRVRNQLTEVRVADLRFTPAEAAQFLNQAMGLSLSSAEVEALEKRTEGWIAGLQLAALSMRGSQDTAGFINNFTGSHRFVIDYLVEEVLQQLPEDLQSFLLRTSILERLCGPLCDAVLGKRAGSGQETLEYLEQANLFIIPLDDERRWYRYHHLFAGLLQQRLGQGTAPTASEAAAELHGRASHWFEENGLEIEAFQHAAAANDIERAAHLVEGEGMPLHYRGALAPVLNWLASLPVKELNARPSLWVLYASVLTIAGHAVSDVEAVLQTAESILAEAAPDEKTRDLLGQIAALRAMLAIPQYELETIISQSRLALELLHPDNVPMRTAATWALGYGYQRRGDHASAVRAYTEVIAHSQASGNIMFIIAAATSLGQIQEAQNQLPSAAESYRVVLDLAGDPPLPAATEAYLGMARILYQWNDLDAAQEYVQQAHELARQMENIDSPAACMALLARLRLLRGDLAGADELLVNAVQFMRQRNFVDRMPEIAAVEAVLQIEKGSLAKAAEIADTYDLPISQARIYLAQGDAQAAVSLLESHRRQVEAEGRYDEWLRTMVVEAAAQQAGGNIDEAVQLLSDALALAEPGGYIRLFVDEGLPMALLLQEARARGIASDYTQHLLAAFSAVDPEMPVAAKTHTEFNEPGSALVEPLSRRELEILQLIAQGLSNREIGERLFLALNTVKGHNRNIFGKLDVHRRTEAVARARELGLL